MEALKLTLQVANGNGARVGFLVLLKTFQRLGYFAPLAGMPERLVAHITKSIRLQRMPELSGYDDSGTRRRHVVIIRKFLHVKPFDEAARRALLDACKEAALTKQDLADIINIGIEELLRLRFELPGFTSLHRTAPKRSY